MEQSDQGSTLLDAPVAHAPDVTPDNCSVIMHTIQGSAIKMLFEACKEILVEVNIVFDRTGLKVVQMDGKSVVLVHLRLYGEEMDYYHCEGQVVAGVDMNNAFKFVKPVSNKDSVCFYVERDDPTNLGIVIANLERKAVNRKKLKLLEIDQDDFQIPDVEFDCVITMQSSYFQNIVRDLWGMGPVVDIWNDPDGTLNFECEGEIGTSRHECEKSTGDSDGVMFTFSDEPRPARGSFPIKYLNLFVKATGLSTHLEMYLKENFPIIFSYAVSTLGTLRLACAPVSKEADRV